MLLTALFIFMKLLAIWGAHAFFFAKAVSWWWIILVIFLDIFFDIF